MDIDLNISLKPLVANLLRINIGQYLKTTRYYHLLLENNLDELWAAGQNQVNESKHSIVFGYDRSEDYEEAFKLIINFSYDQEDRDVFNRLIKITLVDYIEWSNGKNSIDKILAGLENLKMPTKDIIEIKQKIKDTSTFRAEHPSQKDIQFSQVKIPIDSSLCFVIMPFEDRLNPLYDDIIKPVVTAHHLKPLRADEIFKSQSIIEDIWINIKKARLVICDLTNRNANVFYELGLAHALNKEVILITQNLRDAPFDLKHFRIIEYQDTIAGSEKLKKKLGEFMIEHLKK
jgi:hypothetical protein